MREIIWLTLISLMLICLIGGLAGCQNLPSQSTAVTSGADSAAATNGTSQSGTSFGPDQAYVKLPWDGKHKDSNLWTQHLLTELTASGLPDMFPSDINVLCPNYDHLVRPERVEVLANLISKMTQYESGFNPNTTYQEPPPPKGPGTLSIGLLQLSYPDRGNKGCEMLDKAKGNLKDALVNISCGVAIIDKWASSDKQLMGTKQFPKRGCGRYWSVCRTSSKSYERIRLFLLSLRLCK